MKEREESAVPAHDGQRESALEVEASRVVFGLDVHRPVRVVLDGQRERCGGGVPLRPLADRARAEVLLECLPKLLVRWKCCLVWCHAESIHTLTV